MMHSLDRRPVNAHILQVIVVANHMNGKDTHVRGLKVFGPLGYVRHCHQSTDCHSLHDRRRPTYEDTDPFPFTNQKFRLYERIR